MQKQANEKTNLPVSVTHLQISPFMSATVFAAALSIGKHRDCFLRFFCLGRFFYHIQKFVHQRQTGCRKYTAGQYPCL